MTTKELINLVDEKWVATRKANPMAKKMWEHNFPCTYFAHFLTANGNGYEEADRNYVVRTLGLCGIPTDLAERYFNEVVKNNMPPYTK